MQSQLILPKLQETREQAKKLVRKFFKNDYGFPFEMTDSQADIFLLIYLKPFNRAVLLTYTQFGKTDTVSMALIMRTQTFKDNFTIVAGKKSKGMLIMTRVIQHLFDHPRFYNKLEIDKDMPLDRLRRERSKEKITWKGGGSVRILSGQVGNKNAIKEALIGEGGQNIIEEEAPHIPDDVHAMVMRMTIGHKDNFLLKIGNAFNRNHYFKSFNSDKYAKVVVDYHKGLEEGRVTQEQIDEVRDLPFFAELYECKFPDSDQFLVGGYRPLFPDELLQNAFITEEEFKRKYTLDSIQEPNKIPLTRPRLGGDFAGGGNDRTAYVIRWDQVMRLYGTNKIEDTMQQIPLVEKILEDFDIMESDCGLDYGGLGQGVGDRLRELDHNVNLVQFGQKSSEPTKYLNARAYMYYQLFLWLKNGGKIVKHDSFFELLSINYKQNSSSRLQIQPKEELKKLMQEKNLGVSSPDVGDAAALTFADNSEMIDEDDIDIA